MPEKSRRTACGSVPTKPFRASGSLMILHAPAPRPLVQDPGRQILDATPPQPLLIDRQPFGEENLPGWQSLLQLSLWSPRRLLPGARGMSLSQAQDSLV